MPETGSAVTLHWPPNGRTIDRNDGAPPPSAPTPTAIALPSWSNPRSLTYSGAFCGVSQPAADAPLAVVDNMPASRSANTAPPRRSLFMSITTVFLPD
jgi:hypothetical protein